MHSPHSPRRDPLIQSATWLHTYYVTRVSMI
ncbi:unnamed protein product [Timema podura]|uniref:Uncharacterized protein n=1 Tax=Timema podura TaxID=61482 RepID=A0ABN7P4E6_TIMPD|nr:unnamed protein product [Timema podura]